MKLLVVQFGFNVCSLAGKAEAGWRFPGVGSVAGEARALLHSVVGWFGVEGRSKSERRHNMGDHG